MSHVKVFLGGKLIHSNYNNSGRGSLPSPEPAAMSTMVQDILQPGTRRGDPVERRQHTTTPVANTTPPRHLQKWCSAGSYSQRPQEMSKHPNTKICPHRVKKKL